MGEAQQPYNNRGLYHVFGRHLGEESSIGTPFLWIDRSQIVPINLISAILFYDIPLKGSNWVSQLAVDISHHLFFHI